TLLYLTYYVNNFHSICLFFLLYPPTTEIYTLSLHDALPIFGTHKSISTFRGQWFDFRGSRLLATYHPAYLLRNPAAKGEVWKDLQKVMTVLGLRPKKR